MASTKWSRTEDSPPALLRQRVDRPRKFGPCIDGQSWNVTDLYVEIDPEAILVRMQVDASFWHIIDAERKLTWCGLFVFLSQGSERSPRSEMPEDPLRDLYRSV